MTDKRKGQSVFNNIIPALGRLARRGLLLAGLLVAGGQAWAQWTDANTGVSFTAVAGSTGNTNETYGNACDGNVNTKFCVDNKTLPHYVTVEASEAVYLVGYTITTANDNKSQTGRNPQSWTIAGSNSLNGTYTTIATVSADNVLQDLNYAQYSFTCSSSTAYKFFKFTINSIEDGNVMQFSEFHPIAVKDLNSGLSSFSTGYAIYNGTYYMGGTSRNGIDTFNPSTCIWVHDGNKLKDGSGYYLRNDNTPITNSTTNTVLFGANGNGVSSSSGKTVQLNGSRWLNWDNGNTRWTRTGNGTEPNTGYLYYLTQYTYHEISVKPVVSGAATISTLGSTSYSKTDGSYQPAYDDYIYNNNAHHYYIGTESYNNKPTDPIDHYEWALSGISSEYATINTTTGVISYNKSVSTNIQASVTVVAVTEKGNRITSDPYYVTFKPTKLFYISITATAGEGGSVSTTPATLPTVLYGENSSSTSASTSVTFTATPSTGYAFVGWVDANNNQVSTDNPLVENLSATSENQVSPTAYTRKAVFQELPKFYYKVKYTVKTEYADGSTLTGQPGGTVVLSSTETKVAYGATLDASSATVAANGSGITLTATANNGFSFKNWKLANTAVSENLQYTAGGFTVSSKNENSPTEITYTATFGEYPIFYVKIGLHVYEYLATTHVYSSDNKGSDVQMDLTLDDDGILAIHATEPNLSSITKTINLTARFGEGFGFRGWSRTQVAAANIATGPYLSSASNYSISVTTNYQTRAEALASVGEHIYAYFEEFPIFYFKPLTEVIPMSTGVTDPGTASVDPSGTLEFHASSLSATEGSASVTFTATAKTGYKFGGWYKKNADNTYTEVSTYNPYMAKIKSTSKDSNAPEETKLYAQFLTSMLEIEAHDIELDAESDGWLDITVTPADAWKSYIITSAKPSLVYVDNSGHCRSNATPGTTTITIQGVTTSGETPAELYTEVTAKVRVKCKMPTISFSPSTDGSQAMVTLTRSADDAKNGNRATTLYWTTDDPEGATAPTWTKYVDGTPVAVDPDARVYAKSVMLKEDGTPDTDYTESDIAHADYVKPQVEKPSVLIDSDGGVTFSSNTSGTVTYYYKVNDNPNDTDPDPSDATSYTGTWTTGSTKITGIASEKYIRVIGTKAGYVNSEVTEKQCIFASGVSGNTVILNDYEDHTWTYYAGVSSDVDGGNYNNNYRGKLYSPNPRNVKITYKANGGAVSIDESQTEFIYYKTLEESATAGEYKYQVISNPFSKRPTGKGFGGWKITAGADYIKGKAANATLALDEEITFENLPYPSVNCTSAEIELTATWVNLNNTTTLNTNENYKYEVSGGNYETNILIINRDYNGTITTTSPVTIMMVNPDGTADYRSSKTFTGNITPNNNGVTKIEFARWNSEKTITAGYHNLWIGRGITTDSRCANNIVGGNENTTASPKFHVKVESGKFQYMSFLSGYYTNNGDNGGNGFKITGGETNANFTLGNDFDRANGTNTNLQFQYGLTLGRSGSFAKENRSNTKAFNLTVKSGRFGYTFFMENTDIANYLQGGAGYCFYLSSGGTQTYMGTRNITIEGGDLCTIGSGIDSYNNTTGNSTTPSKTSNYGNLGFNLRMKGGTIHGNVYGGAAKSPAGGNRVIVVTGGQIKGWLAAGCNGTDSDGGQTYGTSWVYVGGTGKVDSEGSTKKLGYASGGNVYAAGAGLTGASTCGEMTFGTNLVIADESYIERGIYGGGNYGYALSSTNVYITGGTNAGITDTNTGNSKGAVFGGANQQNGPDVKIWMTGGNMLGGVHGGCNTKGTISGNVTMLITGGQVGADASHTANVHGGGYGEDTKVNGNVDLSIGTRDALTGVTAGSAVIYGDVYGGSALGTVNDATSDHTYVTLNAGTIYGSLYGGGLGNASTQADVNGSVAVKVYGGSVKKTDEDGANGSGGVYGANNINGAPKSTVTVDIYHTDLHNNGSDGVAGTDDDEYALFSVFGGGNQAAYTNNAGYPKVTVHDCDNSIYRVYGGGNKAKVSSTDVTINGGNVIGRVFGGCRGSADSNADVDGNVNLKIYGGRILKAYGGNDSGGEVKGNINLLVSQDGYTESSCPIVMDYLYGGGNNADSKTANMDIRYADKIDYVFGGACSANMDGSINLNIVAGNIGTVFGGNDQLGDISGDSIKVTVNWWDDLNDENHDGVKYSVENNSLGSVYGGGNIADYDGSTTVKVLNAALTGSVYGGGKKADIGGSTNVIIGDWSDRHNVIVGGDVYGGGDQAAVKVSTNVTINDCGTLIVGDVYGGGNAAEVGTEGSNAGSTTVTVWGGTMDRVFGGGHGYPTADPVIGADVFGNTNVSFYGGTANGIFGGSNSVGNITGTATVFLDQQLCPDADDEGNTAVEECELNIQEAYGAGNEAYMEGEPVLTIGCVDQLGEIYGGSRDADISRDIVLNINSGTFRRVFGGNNEGGKIHGSITVNVEETGCHPIIINELYGCGNQAAYNVNWQSGDKKVDPQVNIISCTSIGTVYGGGLGEGAVVTGNPIVHIDMEEGKWSNRIKNEWGNKLGTIGTVFGGGNAAKVDGETQVNIGTEGKSANISKNVYGGGNAAPVTGKTHVQIGQ